MHDLSFFCLAAVARRSRGVKPLGKTRPFVFVDGHRRSLSDVLQVREAICGHDYTTLSARAETKG